MHSTAWNIIGLKRQRCEFFDDVENFLSLNHDVSANAVTGKQGQGVRRHETWQSFPLHE